MRPIRKSVWFGTDHFTPLLTGAHTDGQLSIGLIQVPKGSGSPPHRHTREDEAFYVMEGELTFLYGDRMLTAGPGTFVWGPRGVAHNFTGSSEKPAKALLLVTPTDFDRFAAGFCTPVTDPSARPAAMSRQGIETLLRTAPDYGIEMLPPNYPMPTTTAAAAGASKRLWVMGEHVSYLATAAQTGGQFTAVELITAPAGGPPPHVHVAGEEIMYVIDGRHEVLLDGRTDIAGPGDMIYVPRGTRHRYSNIGSQPGKMLSIHTPGGFEKFFDECGVDAANHPTAPQLPPPPPEAIEALLARHGMTM